MTEGWSSLKLAELIRGAIVKQTLRGRDKNNNPFPKYSTNGFAMP